MSAAPMMGHNKPGEESPLKTRLEADHADLLGDINALADKANRAPKTIKSEDQLGLVGDLAKSASAIIKRADTARSAEKEPYLTAGREIDGFFRAAIERMERIKTVLGQRATEYLRLKEAEERREREEKARREREEAQRLLAEAARAEEAGKIGKAEAAKDKAELAFDKAERAEREAAAPAGDLVRTRSASGASLTTLRKTWAFEIVDLGAVDLAALRPYIARADIEKALRTFVQKGGRQIAGVRIFEESSAAIR